MPRSCSPTSWCRSKRFGMPHDVIPGPKIAEPIRSRAQVDALACGPPKRSCRMSAEAIRLLRRELDGRTPVIGFCGAPFTLAAYLVQGEGKEGFAAAQDADVRARPRCTHCSRSYADAMTDYLRMQIEVGRASGSDLRLLGRDPGRRRVSAVRVAVRASGSSTACGTSARP